MRKGKNNPPILPLDLWDEVFLLFLANEEKRTSADSAAERTEAKKGDGDTPDTAAYGHEYGRHPLECGNQTPELGIHSPVRHAPR
jgi:hypothetical protein